jgi:hypothetical protein
LLFRCSYHQLYYRLCSVIAVAIVSYILYCYSDALARREACPTVQLNIIIFSTVQLVQCTVG